MLNEIIHKFNYDPNGLLAYDSGDFEVFYKDSRKDGLQINLIKMVFTKDQMAVSLSELLVNESKYKIDLNDDDAIGDVINQKILLQHHLILDFIKLVVDH